MKEGKPENPEKNPWSKARTNKKSQPTYEPGPNRTQATLIGGERSHHYAIPVPSLFPMYAAHAVHVWGNWVVKMDGKRIWKQSHFVIRRRFLKIFSYFTLKICEIYSRAHSLFHFYIRKYPRQQSAARNFDGALCLSTDCSLGRNTAHHICTSTFWSNEIRG